MSTLSFTPRLIIPHLAPHSAPQRWLAGGLIAALAVTAFSANAISARHLPVFTPPALSSAASADLRADYGKLPLSFIANAGQTNPATRFQVRDQNGTLSFADSGVTLNLPTHQIGTDHGNTVVHLSFDGAHPAALAGVDKLPGVANFFIGSDSAQWHTSVPTYAGIGYQNLYPGIDLQYAGHTGLLKGTYTVAAGVDPLVIQWRYAGVNSVQIDASNNLIIAAPGGISLTEKAPIAWQTQHNAATPVSVGYRIGANGAIGFAIPAGGYDPALALTIDPGLVYSTYLGGSGNEEGLAIAVDANGEAFVTGMTTGSFGSGAIFPATLGAFQTTLNGVDDAFVTKFNPAGSALTYSTYLGGSNYDQGSAIAVDQAGEAYVGGYTQSSDFPVTAGVFQPINKGNINGFVTRLNATGTALIFSTYLGGVNNDEVNGIALGIDGNAFVTGVTNSPNFPIAGSVVQPVFGGGAGDAFVSMITPSGNALTYSTFLGGVGSDSGRAIAVDANLSVYVTGLTSGAFPITGGAFQPVFGGGLNDAFVARLPYGGGSLTYSTYLGGGGNEEGVAIALDGTNQAYVAGDTTSPNFPVVATSFQPIFGGGTNAFLTKLNTSGSGLIYSTFLGGNSDTQATGVAVDGGHNPYITGFTTGALPVTNQAYQIALGGGGADAFVARFDPLAVALTYSSYLGGAGLDYGFGLALDSSQNVYVVGQTGGKFPVTAGAYQTIFGVGPSTPTDAFVTKMTLPATDLVRKDTIGVYRTGTFLLRLHNSTGFADIVVGYNPATKPYPVVGDWTGSNFDTIGVFDQNNGNFYLRNTNTPGAPDEAFTLGNANDTPLAGRWISSAAHAGAGIFRPSNGLIYLRNTLTTGFADYTMTLGLPGDIGVAGDWTGKGFDSPGVYRPSVINYYLSNQVTNGVVFADIAFTYGSSGDLPVVGDWIGQGHDGAGLFRPTSGFTYLRNALSTGFADNSFFYGAAGDIPVAGHWQLIYPPIAPPPFGSPLIPKTPIPAPKSGGGIVPGDNGISG